MNDVWVVGEKKLAAKNQYFRMTNDAEHVEALLRENPNLVAKKVDPELLQSRRRKRGKES